MTLSLYAMSVSSVGGPLNRVEIDAVLEHFPERAHLDARDAEGFSHADDLVRGQRPRAQALLVATAVHLRFQAHAGLAAHVERADALGSIGLVRGEAHQVDLELRQVDLDLAGGLRR